MNKKDLLNKKKQVEKLLTTGTHTQREISDITGISKVSICKWLKELPTAKYLKIRENLSSELERLSRNPSGKEELIFQYINNLNLLDTMIRKAGS